MAEWLFSVLGFICGAFAIAQFIVVIWCFVDLRRKWRPVPELWGIDWLDIVYRLERDLGVAPTAADFEELSASARIELTAGQLWELLATKIRAGGSELPPDGWERVVAVLSESLNVNRRRIAPDSRLYADLGMVYENALLCSAT
jgi:hypothetical protein